MSPRLPAQPPSRAVLLAVLLAGVLAGCKAADAVAPNAMGRVVIPHAGTSLVDNLQVRACDAAWGANLLGGDVYFWPGATLTIAVEPGCVEIRQTEKSKQVAWWRVASIRPGQTVDLRTLGYQPK